jgi:hypothetical protein
MNNEQLRPDFQAISDRLQEVYDKEDNWDGCDAYAVSLKTFKNASVLVTSLPLDLPVPSIGSDSDGSVIFKWSVNEKNQISMGVSYDDRLFYSAFVSGIAFNGGLRFSGVWPVSVIDIVKSLFE